MAAVLESLVDAGHEVVCATAHPATDLLAAHPNYTHVDMSSMAPHSKARDIDYAQVMRIFRSNAFMVGLATTRARSVCEHMHFDMPEMRDILHGGGGRAFDAVVMESLHSECMSALPGRLGVPVVYVVPSPPVNWMPAATGAPDHPSYLGALLADWPTPSTFGHRLANALVYVHTALVQWYHDAGLDPRWPEPRRAMVFINTHHSMEPARPMGPNVLEIGGIHLNRPVEPLPRVSVRTVRRSSVFVISLYSLSIKNEFVDLPIFVYIYSIKLLGISIS